MTFIEFYLLHRGCGAFADGIERLPDGESVVWIACRRCEARIEKRTGHALAWATERVQP